MAGGAEIKVGGSKIKPLIRVWKQDIPE